MTSLRMRLTLGVALVALIPLALAMAMLAQRIRSTVRTEASERLGAALAVLEGQMGADGERLRGRLAMLAHDPELKRLYLVQSASGRDLADHLAQQQYLLGLDVLEVADTSARVIADGAFSLAAPPPARRVSLAGTAADSLAGDRLAIVSLPRERALAMVALAPILYSGAPVGAVRGGIVLDSLTLARLRRASGMDLALRGADGRIVAATLAERTDRLPPLPDSGRIVLFGRSYLARSVALEPGPGPRPRLTALVSTGAADDTIAALQTTSLLLGLLGVGIALLLGLLWSRQVSRPVERLAAFSQRISRGEWDEPLALESVRELQTLVEALERMRSDLRGYRERLRAGERQAAWSQMARKVAHEIKNPLTPIAISIADLERSYQQQRPDFPQILERAARTISEEVETLKHLLQEFSDFGRFPEPRFAPCRAGELAADLEALYAHEIAEGRLAVDRGAGEIAFAADRGLLRQALVNLVKNGLEAIPPGGRVEVRMRAPDRTLEIAVADNGPGLTDEQRARLFVPDFTTKAHGSGLGLTIVERIVSDHHGSVTVESVSGRGTTFRIRLPIRQEA